LNRNNSDKGQIKGWERKKSKLRQLVTLGRAARVGWQNAAPLPNGDECRTQGNDMLTEKEHFSSRSDSQLIIGTDNVYFQLRSIAQVLAL